MEGQKTGLGSESVRFLTLTQMDKLWCNHIENMNLLKESVSMEVYRGVNPLDEFSLQVSALLSSIITARAGQAFKM